MKMKYLSVQEMVAIEKAADRSGHTYAAMMEAAGKGLAEVLHERFSILEEKTISALIGSGNNGGDALVALDYLIQWGWKTVAVIFRERDPRDPLLERYQERGGEQIPVYSPESLTPSILQRILDTEILLDGVLGTGIKLPLKEPLDKLLGTTRDVIHRAADKPRIVAVDCPSGVDCDTGQASTSCIPADLTVTMAAIKQGLLKFPAYDHVGELVLVDIGLPENLPEWKKITRGVIEEAWVRNHLPSRPLDAHKGTFGTSLIVAGSQAYPGAAALAGRAAYRIGAGLVCMAVPGAIYSGLVETFPEAIWVVLKDQEGHIAETDYSMTEETLHRSTACLVGPGLGVADETMRYLEGLIRLNELPPLVIDADGLRIVTKMDKWSAKLPAGSVLTPHPGEMSALCGLSVNEIQADRIGVAEKYSRQWGQVLLLKGAHSVIADPGGQTKLIIGGEPALATAGSGDVLAGIICGLIAQGMKPFDAAAAGAWLHARAGRLAAQQSGSSAAVLASDISGMIGPALSDLASS
jgi:NAD(P)H-hydrate epimerase